MGKYNGIRTCHCQSNMFRQALYAEATQDTMERQKYFHDASLTQHNHYVYQEQCCVATPL